MMQRVRVGLTGLAFVFLLVMLATAVLRMADNGEGATSAAHQTINATAPAEPLAQLGVAPGNVPQADSTPAKPIATAAKAPAAGQ